MAECSPDDFACTFEIAGEFTLAVADDLSGAALVNVEIALEGNEGLNLPLLGTDAGVSAWLASRELQVLKIQALIDPPRSEFQ